jgi:endonuclease-3 related protein
MASGRPVLTAWRRIPGPPRDPVKARLLRLYRLLLTRYGPQGWWPARTPFEVAVGAILTQHTAWTGAARAIAALRGRHLLTPTALAACDVATLGTLVRPAGTYRLKARRLLDFTRWLLARFDGDFAAMRRAPLEPLRREMLAVPGLGPETVDAILLYAAGRPVFVADAYTRRVLARHRLLGQAAGYEQARAFLEAHLPSDPALFNELHALLVAVGKTHCRASPDCDGCSLTGDLPRGPAVPARRRSLAHAAISRRRSTRRSAASGTASVRARSPMSFRAAGSASRVRTRSSKVSGVSEA